MNNYQKLDIPFTTLEEGERLDELGRKNYQIIQDPSSFCFGMDAVLLSSFAHIKPMQRVLDLGTGNGIIPILLEAKTQADHITGLEIQTESAHLAARSVSFNNLNSKIDIVQGNIIGASEYFGKGVFDVITSNPPYMIGQHGLTGSNDRKMIARHEVLCTFDDIAKEAAQLLKPGGTIAIVHRPFRLVDLLESLVKYKLEPKRIKFVHPFLTKEPNMVLIEAKKGAKSRVTIEKPLIIYKEQGIYTDEIYEIYKPAVYDDREREE